MSPSPVAYRGPQVSATVGTRPQDPVDHAVGLTDLAGIGVRVDAERPIGIVHAQTEAQAEAAAKALHNAYVIEDKPAEGGPIVLERIGTAS